jgi:glycolate oxidase
VSKLEQILPKQNILSSEEECYVYSQDGTNGIIADVPPDVILFPETIEEIQSILKFANTHKIPVVARGAGTNVVGACISEKGGIILNFSKMDKVLEVNKTNMTARVQAGAVVGEIQKLANEKGLFFPLDPSNLRVSTIGGAIAQSAGGPKTFKYGTTKDYILGLKVVLANGELIQTGSNMMKNATGYHLDQLFIGSEGTLGIIVEATLKLIPKPESKRVLLAYFDDIDKATLSVNNMIDESLWPSTIDFMDNNTLRTVEHFQPTGLLVDSQAALIIEIDGFEVSMDIQIEKLQKVLKSSGATKILISKTEEEQENLWKARRISYAAVAKLKPDVVSNDLIVPRENISKLVSGINEICGKYDIPVCTVGHIGDGNLHPQLALDLNNPDEVKRFEKVKKELYELTLNLGGNLSAEHGIGSEKRMFIEKAIDKNTLNCMKKLKRMFDKNNILNPNKIFYLD